MRALDLVVRSEPLGGFDYAEPFRGVLARFRRGRILEKLGRNAEAATFEQFLARWGHAGVPLTEVAEALYSSETVIPLSSRSVAIPIRKLFGG